ncbi:hypothetical protein RJT34_08026 [Clitoria ternatea]|uniref:Uncharacterized protein n=1 Tax=Clitoria ternatea TaxID=43366 RepID=A0AAN9PUK8_CLITE
MNKEKPTIKIGRIWPSNYSLEKRPQWRIMPKSPGRGRQKGHACALMFLDSDPVFLFDALNETPVVDRAKSLRRGRQRGWELYCAQTLLHHEVLLVSACGLPIQPVLKHRPRSLTCVQVNKQICTDDRSAQAHASGFAAIVLPSYSLRFGPDRYALTRALHKRSRSISGATHMGIPPIRFLTPNEFTCSLTHTHVRLLSPCFKMGRIESPLADTWARKYTKACLVDVCCHPQLWQ